MNNKVKQAINRAMGLMARYESIADEALWQAEDKHALYVEHANAMVRAGNSLVWARYQLRAEEEAEMAKALPMASGTSNSLAALGNLLPPRVREIRAEVADLKKRIDLAFDKAQSFAAIAVEYTK